MALVASACGDDDDDAAADTTTTAQTGDTAGDDTTTSAGPSDDTTPGDAADDDMADDVCTADRVGGSLTMGTLSPTASLDPAVVLGSVVQSGTEVTALYDTLTRWDPEAGVAVPHMAESLESDADGSEWTLTLRDGITFSNGDPLTTEAVEYSLERMKTARNQWAVLAQAITEMEVVDPLTIVFRFDEPYPNFGHSLATEAGMVVNPAVAEALGDEFGNAPVGAGAGPFVFERFAPGEEVVLTARDGYWGGPVCIEELRFISVPSAEATYDAFANDELDMALIQEPVVQAEAREAGDDGIGDVVSGTAHIVMNIARAESAQRITHDVRVRQAVAHAIDYDLLNERVWGGTGFSSGDLVWEELPMYPGVSGPDYDTELARQLVDEVKAEGWDGSIGLLAGDVPEEVEMGITIEAMLEAVGMDVEVTNVPQNDRNQRVVAEANFDMSVWGGSLIEGDPWWSMVRFTTGNSGNRAAVSDPDLDAAIAALRFAGTREEKRDALVDVQLAFNEAIPVVNLLHREWLVLLAPDLHGVVESRHVVPMLHDAYIE